MLDGRGPPCAKSPSVIDDRNDVVLEKHLVASVARSVCLQYALHVQDVYEQARQVPAVLAFGGYYFCRLEHGSLTFLAPLQTDVQCLVVIELMSNMISYLCQHFRRPRLDASLLRNKLSIVHCILAEMNAAGFPLTMEPNMLSELVLEPSMKEQLLGTQSTAGCLSSKLPNRIMSTTSWRRGSPSHITNELQLDCTERLDCTIDQNGHILSSAIVGTIECNSRLEGTPTVEMSFADPTYLRQCQLHRCVRLGAFDDEKSVVFLPPDGKFTLLTYRVAGPKELPFYLQSCTNWGQAEEKNVRLSLRVGVKDNHSFDRLSLLLPFPKSTISANLKSNTGVPLIDLASGICTWDLGNSSLENVSELSGSIHVEHQAQPSALAVRVRFLMKSRLFSDFEVDNIQVRGVSYKAVTHLSRTAEAGRVFIHC